MKTTSISVSRPVQGSLSVARLETVLESYAQVRRYTANNWLYNPLYKCVIVSQNTAYIE